MYSRKGKAMGLPTPFDSRKLWIIALTQAALVTLAWTGNASDQLVTAVVTVGGGGAVAQAIIDFTGKGGNPPTGDAAA